MKIIALTKYELKELARNPALWILVILPVIMSKIVIGIMASTAPTSVVLPTWLLFAQVMVGIMLAGPTLLEERYSKTLDALLVTPVGVHGVLSVKGLVVLVLSLVSQTGVLAVNLHGDSHLALLMPLMLFGAVLAIELGMIIGLGLSSPKNGSAVASAVMVILFLAGTVYQAMPDASGLLYVIPSVEVVANMQTVMQTGGYGLLETLGILAWIVGAGVAIEALVRRQTA